MAKRYRLRNLWESTPTADSISTCILTIGDSGQRLVIQPSVLHTFTNSRQLRSDAPEAGGQLFARIDGQDIHLELATGPENLTDAPGTRTNQTDVLSKRKLINFTARNSYL